MQSIAFRLKSFILLQYALYFFYSYTTKASPVSSSSSSTNSGSNSHAVSNIEISELQLKKHIDDWHGDVVVMFYAPWCRYCKQLLPTWHKIAELKAPVTSLQVATFNCEADQNAEVCQRLQVDRYPSIAYLGYGNLNQAPLTGFIFGPSPMPRVARFNSDVIYPEALYDWISFLSFVSTLQRRWDTFFSFLQGKSQISKRLNNMQDQLDDIARKYSVVSKELEKYKALDLFDTLDNHGDPFPLLHSLEPDAVSVHFIITKILIY